MGIAKTMKRSFRKVDAAEAEGEDYQNWGGPLNCPQVLSGIVHRFYLGSTTLSPLTR